jgi:hypothetical protein
MDEIVAKMRRQSKLATSASAFHEKVAGTTRYTPEYRRHFYPPDAHWDEYVMVCLDRREVFLPFYVDTEIASEQWRRVCQKIGVKMETVPTFSHTLDPASWQERVERVFFQTVPQSTGRGWNFMDGTHRLVTSIPRDPHTVNDAAMWQPLWIQWQRSETHSMTSLDFQWFLQCLRPTTLWSSLQRILRYLPVQLFDMACTNEDILVIRHLYHQAAVYNTLPILSGIRMWNQGTWFLNILCCLLRTQWSHLYIMRI